MYNRQWTKRHADTKPDADHWLPTDGAMVWVSDQLDPDVAFIDEPVGPPPPTTDADNDPRANEDPSAIADLG